MTNGEEDIVLKILHTADWHLGKRFPAFAEEQSKRLARARLEVVDRILLEAERVAVDAVLCAGDLFDEPCPHRDFWEQLARRFERRSWQQRPVFLLPGNHDPFLAESVWNNRAFRDLLPAWVHVVDREDFEFQLSERAILYAVPCLSRAGQRDPTDSIPARAPGDERIRIGMVHGSTFDRPDCETDYPISRDAALQRGLDYLALGDTHGFRFVPADRLQPPTIYPGAPEATAFDEKEPGHVALVFFDRQRRARVQPQRVAYWSWEEHQISSLRELSELAGRTDLADRVLRLTLSMRVSARELEQAERILGELEGTQSSPARVGVLSLDKRGLVLELGRLEEDFSELPAELRSVAARLTAKAQQPGQRERSERALKHLYWAWKGRV